LLPITPSYKGWAEIDDWGQVSSVPAWRWDGKNWKQTSIDTSRAFYAWPFANGWIWTWTNAHGWTAVPISGVVVPVTFTCNGSTVSSWSYNWGNTPAQ
jgi:hypothetical protein